MARCRVANLFHGMCCATLLMSGAVLADPMSGIQANGTYGSLHLSTDETFSINIDLDSGGWGGTPADWWMVAYMPWGNWAYYDYPHGWRDAGPSLDDIATTHQGPLFDFSGFEILGGSGLLEGTYHLYFGVDQNMNGILDTPVFYDAVTLTVHSGASSTVNVAGQWAGNWNSSSLHVSGTFAVTIVQWGTLLGGSISVPQIGLSDAQLKGSVQGNNFVFGDIDSQITFNGTLANASAASGNYAYPAWSDSGSWQGLRDLGAADCANLEGRWSITENLISSTCSDVDQTAYMNFVFSQSGCLVAGSDDVGGVFQGDWVSDRYRLTGSRPDADGVTTITDMMTRVSTDGNGLSGEGSWVWSDGSYSCSGRTAITGTRTAPGV